MTDTNGMRVWKLDDCDFVAAKTLDEAIEWYERGPHE